MLSPARLTQLMVELVFLLLGAIMLAISRVPFLWVGKLLAAAGLVLLIRSLLGSFLILKQR